ncbi:MAG: polysaccharide deacetylase family protein [Actinobacteria bacterium]|nr:MAG: polysaccharide deacetylase family protein [Actinomycetota bacterium]
MSDVLVLCYHAVSEDWPAPLSVTPDALERQLSLLARHGFRGVTLTSALADPPAERVVAVTFDDAYRSVRELAWPILNRLGMVGSVYVPTDWPERTEPMRWPGIDQWIGGPHEAELAGMGWAELGELAGAGWEIGSHTRSHPRLPELDDDRLDYELAGSREACEAGLGRRCDTLAYPYGAVDERVLRAADRARYRYAVTLPQALHSPAPLHWPRVGIYHADTRWRFALKVSPAARRLRSSPVWSAIDGVRRRVRGI